MIPNAQKCNNNNKKIKLFSFEQTRKSIVFQIIHESVLFGSL